MGTVAQMTDGRKFTAEAKVRFLEAFRDLGFHIRAARAAGVDAETVYVHLKSDPEFARQYKLVQAERNENMEAEAYRRAVHGVKRPVVQGGKVVKEKVKLPDGREEERPVVMTTYSDDLLKFGLMACMPDKYGNKLKVDANVRQTGVLIAPSPRDARDAELRLAALEHARRQGRVIDVDEELPVTDVTLVETVEDEGGYEAPPIPVDENGKSENGKHS